MSILGRKISPTFVAGAALLMVFAALLPALSSIPEREITLVVKGMAFYLEDDLRTPNPTLDVKAGERVRVIVRNEDRGMMHDFAVPAVGAALDPIRWSTSGEVVFDVPETPGTYEYFCRPHRLMMRGAFRVY